jgi:ATP adenylyltransferase
MTFEELVDFIENKMRMSHVYQPLLIKSLVDAGGDSDGTTAGDCFFNAG